MTIRINDKEYGIIWGIAAIDRYCISMDMEIEPALDILFRQAHGFEQTKALAKFVSCAIDSYAAVNKTEGGVSYEQVLYEFDNQGPELVQELLNDFFKSKLMGRSVADFLNLTVSNPNADKKVKKKRIPAKS